MTLINSLKNNSFIKCLKLAVSNPKKTGLMILFDALFLISLYVLFQLMSAFANSLVISRLSTTLLFLMIAFLSVFYIGYYLAGILIYSFFKSMILQELSSLFGGKEPSFRGFWKFYSLNIVLFVAFAASFLLLYFVVQGIKEAFQPFALIILGAPLILVFYSILNTAHAVFVAERTMCGSQTGSQTYSVLLKRMGNFAGIILTTLFLMALAGIIIWNSFILIERSMLGNNTLYLEAYGGIKDSMLYFFDAVLYILLFVNRISFYGIIKKFNSESDVRN